MSMSDSMKLPLREALAAWILQRDFGWIFVGGPEWPRALKSGGDIPGELYAICREQADAIMEIVQPYLTAQSEDDRDFACLVAQNIVEKVKLHFKAEERDHECPLDPKRAGWCAKEPCGMMQTVAQLRGMSDALEAKDAQIAALQRALAGMTENYING